MQERLDLSPLGCSYRREAADGRVVESQRAPGLSTASRMPHASLPNIFVATWLPNTTRQTTAKAVHQAINNAVKTICRCLLAKNSRNDGLGSG